MRFLSQMIAHLSSRFVQIIALCLLLSPISVVAATFTVTNTNTGGAGSLAQAILDANANSGADIINFSIGTGLQTISPMLTGFPDITDPVTIDGFTQPGAVSGATPDQLTLMIVLDGISAGNGVDGLHITGGNTTVRGLVIQNWNPFGEHGILMDTNGGNTISKCFLGTDNTGTADQGNGQAGIFILSSAPNNTVDGVSHLRKRGLWHQPDV